MASMDTGVDAAAGAAGAEAAPLDCLASLQPASTRAPATDERRKRRLVEFTAFILGSAATQRSWRRFPTGHSPAAREHGVPTKENDDGNFPQRKRRVRPARRRPPQRQEDVQAVRGTDGIARP